MSKRQRKTPTRTLSPLAPVPKHARRRAVIFDIDGTLVDSFHRSKMITDWVAATNDQIHEYAALMHKDTPIPAMVELCRTLHTAGYAIVLLTSRDATQYAATVEYFDNYGIPFDELVVRDSIDDRRSSRVYKAEKLALIRERYDVEFAIDDENGVTQMFRAAGVPCLQCDGVGLPELKDKAA